VWVRVLGNVRQHDLPASIVIAVFMLGLGAGGTSSALG
jgi:hypothetical protein